jgi:hypothetical protein
MKKTLSPLSFNIVLEFLARRINKRDPNRKGRSNYPYLQKTESQTQETLKSLRKHY